jgi:hypothetical protein
MIISVPVQTAVCAARASGAFVVEVAVQASVPGLYMPPLLKYVKFPSVPPHTIISLPVQTAVCENRAAGALMTSVVVQLFVAGL